jgi:hypothetical protein
MVQVPLPLPRESTIGRHGQDANTRIINGYVEIFGQDNDGKSTHAIYTAAGLQRFDTGTISDTERGMIALDENNFIVVLGLSAYNVTSAGVVTRLGGILGTGRVTIARNLNGTPQVGVVTENSIYYLIQGGAVSVPSEANLPAPNSICYVRGHFVYGISDGRIFASPLDAGTGINALSFDYANSESDDLVRVYASVGYLYVFGTRSLEIWQATGDVPFPFGPIQQNIALGLGAKYSVAETEKGLLWVDHKGIVRYGRDGGAQRVSTHSVERSIGELSAGDRANITGFTYISQGHQYYVLNASTWTWVYDTDANRWYERKTYGQTHWIAADAIWFGGKYIVASNFNGNLFEIDQNSFLDSDTRIVLEVWCQNTHNFPGGVLIDSLDVDILSGVGVSSGNLAAQDPKIMIDYSDDGGKTFQGERRIAIGKVGQYRQMVRSGRWGRTAQKGRIWRLRAPADVLRGILQASLRVRPCNG